MQVQYCNSVTIVFFFLEGNIFALSYKHTLIIRILHLTYEIQFQEFIMNLILCKPESFSLFMLIQFRKIMNLQPSWPSYQPHKQVYCLHSLGKICAQFQEKTAMHLSSYAWCNIHWSQSLTKASFTLT